MTINQIMQTTKIYIDFCNSTTMKKIYVVNKITTIYLNNSLLVMGT